MSRFSPNTPVLVTTALWMAAAGCALAPAQSPFTLRPGSLDRPPESRFIAGLDRAASDSVVPVAFDFDRWVADGAPELPQSRSYGAPIPSFDFGLSPADSIPHDWHWQCLPDGLIYKSYLAGVKESRMAAVFVRESDDGWLFDGTMGGRFGLFRYGDRHPIFPSGWQVDLEASAQLRLDIAEQRDLRSTDYRAGIPITYGWGRHRTKFAYYHLSSHVGDEFLLKHPGFPRLNYVRDSLVLGHTFYLSPALSLYAEAGWGLSVDVAEPWEFQFGLDYAPPVPTGVVGAPFFAVNGHLREEVDFSGSLAVQAGWAWRSADGRLFRSGLHYLNGKSSQFSFFDQHEQQIGLGMWFDF